MDQHRAGLPDPQLPLNHDRFTWPYSGMIRDLSMAIDGRGNVLAGVGLLVLTEVLGRIIHEERRPAGSRPGVKDAFAFCLFYEEFMGCPGGSGLRVYGAFRCGLVHDFAFKRADESFVIMNPDARWVEEEDVPGIFESADRRTKSLLVNAYWRDWQRGLAKWARERPDLVLRSA